ETKNVEFRLSSPTDDRLRYTIGAYGEQSKYGIDSGHGYLAFDSLLAAGLNGAVNGVLAGFGAGPSPYSPAQISSALITDVGTPYGYNRTTSLAGYGQVTYDFTDEWSLTAGLRY